MPEPEHGKIYFITTVFYFCKEKEFSLSNPCVSHENEML